MYADHVFTLTICKLKERRVGISKLPLVGLNCSSSPASLQIIKSSTSSVVSQFITPNHNSFFSWLWSDAHGDELIRLNSEDIIIIFQGGPYAALLQSGQVLTTVTAQSSFPTQKGPRMRLLWIFSST